jgi:hypothetical protein
MAFWNLPSTTLIKQQHKWVITRASNNTDSENLNNVEADIGFFPFYLVKSVEQPSYTIDVQQAKYLYSHTFNFPKRLVWNPISITFYDVLLDQGEFEPFREFYVYDEPVYDENEENNGFIIESRKDEIGYNIDGEEVKNYSDKGFLGKFSTQSFLYGLIQQAGYFNPKEFQEENLATFKKAIFKKDLINSFIGENCTLILTHLIEKRRDNARDPKAFLRETWKIYNPIVSDVKFDKLDYSQESVLTVTLKINYDWAELVPATPAQYILQDPLPRVEKPDEKVQPTDWISRQIKADELAQQRKENEKNRELMRKDMERMMDGYPYQSDPVEDKPILLKPLDPSEPGQVPPRRPLTR